VRRLTSLDELTFFKEEDTILNDENGFFCRKTLFTQERGFGETELSIVIDVIKKQTAVNS